jgi:flagellar FliJ protein
MFQFRLQKLLELRRLARDQRRTELAKAYEAENILGQQREQLLTACQQVRDTMRHASRPGKVSVDRLLSAHRHELVLRSQLAALEQQSRQVLEEVQRRRQMLLEAEKEYRVMEKLRERLQERYRRETDKQELKQLDEIALRGAHRQEAMSWEL